MQEKAVKLAANLCSELATLSSAEKAVLRRLFSQSSSGRKHPAGVAFDPLVVESPALTQFKKKECNMTPEPFSNRIPPKRQNQSLVSEGMMKTLIFKHSMSAVQVSNVIIRDFPEIKKISISKHAT